jgi:hypothetical protein
MDLINWLYTPEIAKDRWMMREMSGDAASAERDTQADCKPFKL